MRPHVPSSAGEEEPLPLAYAPSPSSALPGGLLGAAPAGALAAAALLEPAPLVPAAAPLLLLAPPAGAAPLGCTTMPGGSRGRLPAAPAAGVRGAPVLGPGLHWPWATAPQPLLPTRT